MWLGPRCKAVAKNQKKNNNNNILSGFHREQTLATSAVVLQLVTSVTRAPETTQSVHTFLRTRLARLTLIDICMDIGFVTSLKSVKKRDLPLS